MHAQSDMQRIAKVNGPWAGPLETQSLKVCGYDDVLRDENYDEGSE